MDINLLIIFICTVIFFVIGFIAGSAGRKIEYKDRVVPGDGELLFINNDNFKIATNAKDQGFMQKMYTPSSEIDSKQPVNQTQTSSTVKVGAIKRPTARDLELKANPKLKAEMQEMEKDFKKAGIMPNE